MQTVYYLKCIIKIRVFFLDIKPVSHKLNGYKNTTQNNIIEDKVTFSVNLFL